MPSADGKIGSARAHEKLKRSSPLKVDRPLGDPFVERFESDCARGRLVGSRTGDGVLRRGVDKEHVLSIDNGALRIEPLVRAGWGRAGVAYGPYRRRNGLGFAVNLVNGHNVARSEPLPERLSSRVWRWLIGSESDRLHRRVFAWARSRQKAYALRRLMHWFRTGTRFFSVPSLEENLAVGWFPTEAPSDPLHQGNALVVHSVIPEGGELWARLGTTIARSLPGLQSVPMCYAVVLREQGAAYYASSFAEHRADRGLPPMRPLAIDPFNRDETVYAGIHQSVLYEIGFRADTRVHTAAVADLADFQLWYGSAHAADLLTGSGSLHGSPAECGGRWTVSEGTFERTELGVAGIAPTNTTLVDPGKTSGLIHLLVDSVEEVASEAAIIWRAADAENFWCFEVGYEGARLALKESGQWSRFPRVTDCRLERGAVTSIQVADDGQHLRLYVNNVLAYGMTFTDRRLAEGTGVGVRMAAGRSVVRAFEAHPREIDLLWHMEPTEPVSKGTGEEVVGDDFSGPAGDLDGRVTSVGQRKWRKELGDGAIHTIGQSAAKVVASAERPCPGRTAYTIPWSTRGFADVEVAITAPRKRPGMKERCRGGLILWQDAQNYVTFNLWQDDAEIFSISSFYQVGGYEELYDAVWTNIGRRVRLGEAFVLRVTCDGTRFCVFVNGEPVLYRALTDVYPFWQELDVRRVGILANWEWGTDTGTIFERFVVRNPPV